MEYNGEDSFTMGSEDFILPTTPSVSRDAQPKAPSRRSTVHEMPMRLRPAILLFGDSLTEYGFGQPEASVDVGWASLLSAAYSRRADVLNRGFSGYNTEWALNLVPKIFGVIDQVLFATVWLGANDAAVPGHCQHVPIDAYQENLASILRLMRARMKNSLFPIILLTPPPVDEVAWKEHMQSNFPESVEETGGESNRKNSMAREYGEAAKKAAGMDPHCVVLDVWELLEGETEHRGKYLSDGLHLNSEGNRKVYQAIMERIEQYFPRIAPMRDGDGKYGKMGAPLDEKLWKELAGIYNKQAKR